MKNKIVKKEKIVQVGKIKLFDEIGGEMVVGFSDDGSEVYTREMGEGGSCWSIEDALELKETED